MSDQSKAQQAALQRLRQMVSNLKEEANRDLGEPWQGDQLQGMEKDLDRYLKEIPTLVKEYGLDESVATTTRNECIDIVWQKAGSYGAHLWQARLAKKHGV